RRLEGRVPGVARKISGPCGPPIFGRYSRDTTPGPKFPNHATVARLGFSPYGPPFVHPVGGRRWRDPRGLDAQWDDDGWIRRVPGVVVDRRRSGPTVVGRHPGGG